MLRIKISGGEQRNTVGDGKTGEGQKVQTPSYNKSWGCNVQHRNNS